LALFTEKQDLWKTTFALEQVSYVYMWMGKYREASQCLRQMIAISEQCGDLRSLGEALNQLCGALKCMGEFAEGQRVAQKSLEVNRAAARRDGTALSLKHLSEVASHMGDFLQARQYAEASLALFQEVGLTSAQDALCIVLGNIECSLGNLQRARFYFYPILEAYLRATTWISNAADAATGMAAVLIKEGRATEAAEVLTAVLHNVNAWQDTKDLAAKLLAEVEPTLPDGISQSPRPLYDVVAELLTGKI
jgi:tetratricopeptide (TPR) repeat protein